MNIYQSFFSLNVSFERFLILAEHFSAYLVHYSVLMLMAIIWAAYLCV